MYIDQGDSLAQKTGSRKLIKKRSTFCPIQKAQNTVDYEFQPSNFKIFDLYPALSEYKNHFEEKQAQFESLINHIFKQNYSLDIFAKQYEQFGVLSTSEGFFYKEYAPNAIEIYLTGDFNNWNKKEYPLVNDGQGVWQITLPQGVVIPHQSRVCAYVRTSKDQFVLRVPIGARYISKLENDGEYCEIFWNPPEKYVFQHFHPHKPRVFKIYRAEISKCGPEKRPYSYAEFAQTELNRIKELGYNAVLLGGIQEHQIYGSSHSVLNPYSVSSEAGTPDDLKKLVDKAHELGLYVAMDIIHSHASAEQGFNGWDGSHFSYFVDGPQGLHPSGGRFFNFAKWETQRLLLSNLGYFINEYKIDGFRFIDVPSIIYKHHGKDSFIFVENEVNVFLKIGNYKFNRDLKEFFNENLSLDGLVYLMLANETIHKINQHSVTFAEDFSNFPSLCVPLDQGGIGFDFRVSLRAASQFATVLNETENVDKSQSIELFNYRHPYEKIVSSLCYKSSDIILKEVKESLKNIQDPIVFKQLSLHKLARMIILTYGGDSYLNRYGNEFGTSEEYLRTDLLKESPYKELLEFDKAVLNLEESFQILSMKEKCLTEKNNGLIVFERGNLVFIFNLGNETISNHKIGTKWSSDHSIIFNSDKTEYGGLDRVKHSNVNVTSQLLNTLVVRPFYFELDIPSFCGIVLQPTDTDGIEEEQKQSN